MNTIFTDPRTAGCNGGDASIFPDDSLRTETLASDILAMIRALNLKKYIIYGHSYGTVLATEVASRAGSGEAPVPVAVILSGVMGKSARDDESVLRGLNSQWAAISADLPKDSLTRIDGAVPPASLSPEDWTYYLTNGLYRGSYLHDGRFSNELSDQLLLLQSESSNGGLQFKAARDAHIPDILTDGFSDRLFKLIDCHEISSSDPNEFLFTGNSFIPLSGSDPCAGESLDRPFDPAQWPISVPIFYLSGDHDPAAPYSGARYHFESQTAAPHRYFMTVPGGGHDEVGMVLGDCKAEFWSTVLAGGAQLDAVLKHCIAPIELEVR